MDPWENEADDDVVSCLLTSYYDIYDEYDDNDEKTYKSKKQRQMVIHHEDIPPSVRNVYILRLRKQTDNKKENIDQSMFLHNFGMT